MSVTKTIHYLKWMTQDVNESTQKGCWQMVDEKVAYVEALENANSVSRVGTMCLGMIIMNYFSFSFFLDFFIFPS